jgi:hypothetical protein
MDNPKKLATQGTQEEETQRKNTTQCVLDTTILQTISTGLLSNPSTQVFMIKFINFSNLSKYSLIFAINTFIDFLLLT